MDKKIIIASDEAIVCPSCNHQFALDPGVRHQLAQVVDFAHVSSQTCPYKRLS